MAPPSRLFEKYRWFSTIVVCIYVLTISSTDSVNLTIEKPKKQQTSAKLDILGIETFDGLEKRNYPRYKAIFTNSSYTGTYHNLRIQDPNSYGGAGGEGFHPVANEWSYFKLKIKHDEAAAVCTRTGPNYFGLWISSIDVDNRLEFYYEGNRIYVLNVQDVKKLMGGQFAYRSSPTYRFWLSKERSVFVNVFFNDMTYDEIRFAAQAYRFESDNHSVGRDTTQFCEVTPEPTTTTTQAPPTSTPTRPTTTPARPTTTTTPPTTTPTQPTAPIRPAIPIGPAAPILPTAPPRPETAPTPQVSTAMKFLIAAVVVAVILALVAVGMLIFDYCRPQPAARPNLDAAAETPAGASVAAEEGQEPQRDVGERERQAATGGWVA